MGTEPTAKLGGAAELSTDKITTSTRDPEELGRRIGAWMATVLPPGADPEVGGVVTPEGNGMSSETILFDAAWTVDGERRQERCVARIEPEMDKVPVFPSYELAQQFDVMSLVAEATSVPIPETLWYEGDRSFIGAPFFVMARIDGIVPPDVLPYTFGDCWVDAATPEQRATLQDSAVRALAGVHTVTTETHDLSALQYDRPGETALERHLAWWEGYHEWVVGDRRSPLLDECFAWLRAHLPADVGPDSLSWGDARIGNMMFADFECVAVLDWEMAGVAPPEVDLGWMAYLHLFFQDLATDLGVAGLLTSCATRTWRPPTGRSPGARWATCAGTWRARRAPRRDHAPGDRAGGALRGGGGAGRPRRDDHPPGHPAGDARRLLLGPHRLRTAGAAAPDQPKPTSSISRTASGLVAPNSAALRAWRSKSTPNSRAIRGSAATSVLAGSSWLPATSTSWPSVPSHSRKSAARSGWSA
ncbi:MAG: phosphotransferase family protein [Acidimicrobiales bacterium]